MYPANRNDKAREFFAQLTSEMDQDELDDGLRSATFFRLNYLIWEFVREGADLNVSGNGPHQTLLNVACFLGNSDTVRELLFAGADVNRAVDNFPGSPEEGSTALHLACGKGSEAIATLLIESGATINARTASGKTPLMIASLLGHTEIVNLLMTAGADPYIRSSDHSFTALMYACANGKLEAVRALVNSHSVRLTAPTTPAAVNKTESSSSRLSLLMLASYHGRVDIAEFLVSHGAYLDEKTVDEGITALYLACCRGKDDVARLLVEAGAHVDTTILPSGLSALDQSIRNCNQTTALIMLEATANVRQISENLESSLLSLATISGKDKVARRLLALGDDIEKASRGTGFTPLIWACEYQRTALARFYVTTGANVNHVAEPNGETALTRAAARATADTVELLLENGANPELGFDSEGRNALAIARDKGHDEIASLIESHSTGDR